MHAHRLTALLVGASLLGACNPAPSDRGGVKTTTIKVRGPEQDKLHKLAAFDLAIGLKRAIYSAGYTCQRLIDGGFVGTYQNMDIWMAKCADGKEWAVFAGPDGSAQVRDCKDVVAGGLPKCVVAKRPAGSFTERTPVNSGKPAKRATFDGLG